VAFFLAGLIIHGSVQSWWIEPVLGNLSEVPLMLSAVFLTSFNDNAAITYLSTFVKGFSDGLKYVIVAGAVTGGGLTVIANAPNPAGQSILKRYFPKGLSAYELLKAAIFPSFLFFLVFLLFR
jgi:Na+/H+ antiporter NhaD/arsenite permease-like protein